VTAASRNGSIPAILLGRWKAHSPWAKAVTTVAAYYRANRPSEIRSRGAHFHLTRSPSTPYVPRAGQDRFAAHGLGWPLRCCCCRIIGSRPAILFAWSRWVLTCGWSRPTGPWAQTGWRGTTFWPADKPKRCRCRIVDRLRPVTPCRAPAPGQLRACSRYLVSASHPLCEITHRGLMPDM